MSSKVIAYLVIHAMLAFGRGWFFGSYIPFLQANGLSLFQANLVNSVFFFASFLLNPPTGYLADHFGRRKISLLGQVFWGGGMFIYWQGTTFASFLLAESVAAIGSSLLSGALDSWLRDSVEESSFERAIAWRHALETLAQIPSTMMGSWLFQYVDFHLPWLMAGLSTMGATTISVIWLSGFESENVGSRSIPPMSVAILDTFRSRSLRLSLVVTLVATACFQPFNMFWSPILNGFGAETWWLGTTGVAISVAVTSIVGSFLAGIKRIELTKNKIALSLVIVGIPMLASPWLENVVSIFGVIMAYEFGIGLLRPYLLAFANRYMESEIRATKNSVVEAARTLGGAGGLALSGWLTQFIPPLTVWGFSAIVLVGLALYIYWWKE